MGDSDAIAKTKRAAARLCSICDERRAALNDPKPENRECFYIIFEEEIHKVIVENNLFQPGERIAVAASGGKGITGYRDDSLEIVKRNEIQKYAYFKSWTTSLQNAFIHLTHIRGFAREFIKDLERIRLRAILDIIRAGENFRISTSTKMLEQGTCERCGYISSQKLCKACVLLEGLNRGLPKMGIGRSRGPNSRKKSGEPRNLNPEVSGSNLESKQCGSLEF